MVVAGTWQWGSLERSGQSWNLQQRSNQRAWWRVAGAGGAGCGVEGHPQIPLEPWVSGSDLDVETLACCQARGGDGAFPVVLSVKIR